MGEGAAPNVVVVVGDAFFDQVAHNSWQDTSPTRRSGWQALAMNGQGGQAAGSRSGGGGDFQTGRLEPKAGPERDEGE